MSGRAYFDGPQIGAVSFIREFSSGFAVLFLTLLNDKLNLRIVMQLQKRTTNKFIA